MERTSRTSSPPLGARLIASVDVGSNATRMLVAELAPTLDYAGGHARPSLRVVHQARVPLRMGHEVFRTGHLPAASIEGLRTTMLEFRQVLDSLRVDRYRAVITASAREADNADELLQVVQKAGIELSAIDGAEEARLGKIALASRVSLQGKRALVADLGGGSLELTEVNHDEVRFSSSLEIGTVRLLEAFLSDGPVTAKQERVLSDHLDRMLAPHAADFVRRNFDLVAGMGGNFDAVAELAPGAGYLGLDPDGPLVPSIDVRRARQLLGEMKSLGLAERRERFDLKADRADVIVPALFVIDRVADLARTETILAPGVGLKEGLLVELARRVLGLADAGEDNQMVRSAVLLGRRFHFDETHATQVDRLACQLFDVLSADLGLAPRARVLLRIAAVVHDIGEYVEASEHHKHTYYLVDNSEILGLSPQEKRLVANIARYHRRADPSTEHAPYKALTHEERRVVAALAALLRIADALDRGRRSKVTHIGVAKGAKKLQLEVGGRDDISLELWTAQQKSPLLAKTLGVEVALSAREL